MKKKVADPSAPAVNTSLDPADWSGFRAQAHRMLDDMLGYIEGIREQPVWQAIPDDARMHFRRQLPAEPTPLDQVHQEFMNSILPFTARNGHPAFLGWVQGGGTPVGMLAEMLAAGLNANLGGRDQIPVEVERQVTEWMRTLFGFPAGATGLFVTGTSMANLIAVKVARDAKLGCEVRRSGISQPTQKLISYASAGVHGCIARALDLAGLGSDSLRLIPVDPRNRMDLGALAAAVEADRKAGLTPFLVTGTAGTVDTGAIDDLDGIADFCAREELWFHIDGACGALAMLAPELAPRLKGIERADSLAFDFHKWAQVPYDAGFLLVRNGTLHQNAFASTNAYLARDTRGISAGSPWPCDFGPDLSRGFRALKAWATIRVYGTNAIGAVISNTCELARYLESRIAAIPELELMAPVELNVVCFRYRCGGAADAPPDEFLNRLNHQIVVTLQESGAVAPSTTILNQRLVIRAAIVNHRTTRAEIDTLVEAVQAAGKSLSRDTPAGKSGEQSWKPWLERTAKLEQIDAQLNAGQSLKKEAEVELRYIRAMLLMQLGRPLEARTEHLKVVSLDPAHERNLNALGLLLAVSGNRKAALIALGEAVRQHPESTKSRVNLGGVLLEERNAASDLAAREQFEAALALDPSMPQAHAGLSYALTHLGEFEAAEHHRRIGFGQKSCFTNLYRGNGEPVPLVLLVSSTGGNTPIEKLIDDSVFQTHVVVAGFFDSRQPLPPHRLVVNGIGDVDVSLDALLAAESLLARTSAPVLNAPAAVRVTSRCENAARLRNIPGIIAPETRFFPWAALAAADGAEMLLREGFNFPLLLRAPGFHMGEHFVQVESPAALASAVAELPGEGRPEAQLLAIEYLDARGADGYSRKFRVMMIDGQLYPLHLALSPHWKIHYFSSDMADQPDHRAEEAQFLTDMDAFLGPHAIGALKRLQTAMGLDYGGIDFGLSPRGEILLFEANATMVVQHPDQSEQWDYRRAAVDRIHAAVRRMLMRHAGVLAEYSEARPLPLVESQMSV
ncbi:MAG TPA: pyridoxal-dependent decarboxylase [Acidobacteriaceae bacterium]|nr:pyridoxal-dependent decarboxylase [Acidobacteriaceae bacterium]